MTPNIVDIEMLLAWPILLVALMLVDKRHRGAPLFLTYAYIAALAVNHFPGAVANAMPWKPFLDSTNTVIGFYYSTIGLAGFVVGAALVPKTRGLVRELRLQSLSEDALERGERCAKVMLVSGAILWFAEHTPISGLPSINSVISAGKQLVIGGICLKCWISWHSRNYVQANRWLMLAVAFPIYTVLSSGFLSYGTSFLMTILIFVGMFYRPRWSLVALGSVSVYAGLSVFPAYMQNRTEIRSVLWGESSLDERLGTLGIILNSLKPFDFRDDYHLIVLDGRLNQNALVGAAVNYVPSLKDYAAGETIYMALIALVPRAIWPDKPVVAGSMGMVTDYTGISFAHGTSVGMGQVMEFYINYSTEGLIVGFMLLGALIRAIDFKIAESLLSSNWPRYPIWFMVGTATLQPIGQLLEISSSMGGAAVLGYAVTVITARTGVKARLARTRQ